MNTNHLDPVLEQHAKLLERHEGFRVLRKVPPPYSLFPDDGTPPPGKCIGIVDLETSGLDPENDTIIELAVMLVWVDEEDEVTAHIGPFSWLEDPEVELDPRVSLVTGLANHMLTGHKIDDVSVEGYLSRADVLVSHNAAFEIGFLERRYPSLRHTKWGCSLKDIDWLMAGLDGRAQGSLLAQHGWYSEAHRASPDVWALFVLLMQRRCGIGPGPNRSHLQRLLQTVETDTVMVEARGAPFGKKDALKARQYRWNANAGFWEKELSCELVEHEEAWHYRHGLKAPTLRAITARERHR